VGNSTNPFVPCCASGDHCLAHGLCHYSRSKVGGSGYYVSGCTDSTYKGKNCPKICTSRAFPDVTWNSTARLWQCCGVDTITNSLNCNAPTNEQFDAPGPNYIKTYWPPARSEPKPNVGVIIGSVVAGVVVVLLLVSALLLWRRRKSKQERIKYMLGGEFNDSHSPRYGSPPKSWLPSLAQPVELQDSAALAEMEVQPGSANHGAQKMGEVAELDGSSPARDEVVVLPYGVLATRK